MGQKWPVSALRSAPATGEHGFVNDQQKKAGQQTRVRRISIGLELGVHEALTNVAQRSGLRPGDVAREALRCYEPLLAECYRLDRGRPL